MVKEIGWDDEDVVAGSGENIFYKAEAGRKDRIRILDKAIAFNSHWLPELDGGTYIVCGLEEYGECPVCDIGNKPSQKYACTIAHLTAKKGKNDEEKVKEIKVWIFGPDKYVKLREVGKTFKIGVTVGE